MSLTQGWVETSLAGLLASSPIFIDGDWVETKDQDPNGEVRLTQLADVGVGKWRNRSARFMNLSRAKEMGCTFLEAGDVLVARMPEPLGRACIFPGDSKPCVTAVDVCIIRPDTDVINAKWLMWALNSPGARKQISALQSGTTRKRISRRHLGTIKLALPSRIEQDRIVAEIEAQFSRLDSADVLVDRSNRGLRLLRMAILQCASEGLLTAGWREDHPGIQSGAKLLQGLGGEPAAHDSHIPDSWAMTGIQPLLSSERPGMKTGPFGSLLKKHEYRKEGIPVIGIENVEPMKFVHGSRVAVTPEKAEELAGYDVQVGDVLISRSGTVGEVCVAPDGLGAARFSSNLMRVVLRTDGMSPDFFALLFNGSSTVLSQVSELCKGTTRDFINQRILSSIVFPLPPLEEQREILTRVKRLFSLVEDLERELLAASQRSSSLRRSILSAAFSGRLVPQGPGDGPSLSTLARIGSIATPADAYSRTHDGELIAPCQRKAQA